MTEVQTLPRATSSQQLAAWRAREVPDLERVRDDLWAIPVPVPGNPIRYTYVYLLRARDGAVLVDAGADSEWTLVAIERGLAAAGMRVTDVIGIVITHFHFDHWQAADRIAAATGAWVALSRQEVAWANGLSQQEIDADSHRRFSSWGVPPEEIGEIAASVDYGEVLEYARPQVLVEDGDVLPVIGHELQVLVTPGHTPGHVCLYDRTDDLLLSGDHLLPGISPHIALNPFGLTDPLSDYLKSLDRVSLLGEPEVLPAHQYRFTGVRERVKATQYAVERRLAEVRTLVRKDPNADVWGIARNLSWSRAWDQFSPQSRRMALDETAAHLRHLMVI